MLQTSRCGLAATAASHLFLTLVRASMLLMTDEVGKKISKLNIPLTVIVSVCCARTDCSVLLPCWKAVYFSSLPLLFYVSLSSFFPIIAIWHSPFHCQSVPCCVTVDLLHWCPAPWSPLVKVCDKTLHCTISSCLAWQLGDKRSKYACKTGHLLSK